MTTTALNPTHELPKPTALASCGGYAAARDEIRQAIIFYEGRGWDWLPLVSYLAAKANGEWPK